jgi:hypothetical protein
MREVHSKLDLVGKILLYTFAKQERSMRLRIMLIASLVCLLMTRPGFANSFSDSTKSSLIDACHVDLPRKLSGGTPKIDPATMTMLTQKGCACLFNYFQNANPPTNGNPLTDADYQKLAAYMKSGSTSLTVPGGGSPMIAIMGATYVNQMNNPEVQACMKKP